MTNRDLLMTVVFSFIFLALSLPLFWDGPAVELAPVWIAATFAVAGDFAAIYPGPGATFTVTAPQSWVALATEAGHTGAVLPYIYPPLWAGLLAPLTKLITLSTFQNAVLIINHLALLGVILCARRIAAPTSSRALYLGLGLLVLQPDPSRRSRFFQNQPQIIVAFLTLLAIELSRAGAPLSAGAILAVAASIKVEPILILPALLASPYWRSILLGFTATGGALGLLSIDLGGWPVHSTFLTLLSTISGTVILNEYAYTFDALIAQFGFLNAMDYFSLTGDDSQATGWCVGAKPGLWSVISALILIALTAAAYLTRRLTNSALIWPVTLILLGLFGSFAWSFHFIAPLAFLSALAVRFGPKWGTLAVIELALPGSYLILPLARDSAVLPFADQALGVLTLMLTAIVFAFLARNPDQPLHPTAPHV